MVALIALLVVTSLAANLLQRASMHRRDVRRQDWALQADWLAESGLSRAVARSAADRDYREETWQVPAEQFGGHDGGRVRITVAVDEDAPARRTITVVADFPDRLHDRARSRRVIAVER